MGSGLAMPRKTRREPRGGRLPSRSAPPDLDRAHRELSRQREPTRVMEVLLDELLALLHLDKGCFLLRGPRGEMVFGCGRTSDGKPAGAEEFLLRRPVLDRAREGPPCSETVRHGTQRIERVVAARLPPPAVDSESGRADSQEIAQELLEMQRGEMVYLVGRTDRLREWRAAVEGLLESASVALAQARLLSRLERERRRLAGLYRLAVAAGSSQDLKGLGATALDIVLGETGSRRGFLVLSGADDDDAGLCLGRDAAGRTLPEKDAGIHLPRRERATPPALDGPLPTRLPLVADAQGGAPRDLGAIYLDRKLDPDSEARDGLTLLLSQIASTVDRFRLRATQAERMRLEDELRQAEKVQALLLPRRLPDVVGLSFDAEYHLSRGLGGDYYDFIDMGGDHVGVAIADVLGHSVSSAIVMSTCRTLLREYCRHETSPALILSQANDTLERNLPDDMFVTLFLAVLDLRTFAFTYANAGQCYPLHFQAGPRDFQVLAVGGLPLGFQRGVAYREAFVELDPGDILVLYTDGATEMKVDDVHPLGVKGLCRIVRRLQMTESPRLARDVYRAVREEAGQGRPSDDVTLIALRVSREVVRDAFEIRSTEAALREAVERAESFARRRGFVSERILQFRLVLTEALMNALEHGNRRDPAKTISVVLTADDRRMSVRIRDQGDGYDADRVLQQANDPDLTSTRGRGLTIIQKYVDNLQVFGRGNAITITFSRSTF